MPTATIPKTVTGGDELVVIPRKLYESFLVEMRSKKTSNTLDEDLQAALREYKAGEYYGPFDSAKDTINFLLSRRRKKNTR